MVTNGSLRLDLDPTGSLRLYVLDGGTRLLAAAGPALPDADLSAITLTGATAVSTALGAAQRLIATAESRAGQLRQTLTVDSYPQWPDAFILQWRFENLGSEPLPLTGLACPALQLVADWLAGTTPWTFQGAAVAWGQDFAFPLPEQFARENSLGHRDHGEGGGIPLIYCWNRRAGLALACVEPTPVLWSLPVSADPQQGVRLALTPPGPLTLAPGATLDSPRALVSLHHGDFYAPLTRYRELLSAQGLAPAVPHAEDYAPAWCSWGYEFDVRPVELVGVLPKLRELGLHWLTLDDRWFDRYGDWNPRADTFPGGAARLRALVDELHAAGVYAQLWWYPLCVEDGIGGWDSHTYGVSEVLRAHPDWLLLNADGSVARNNRGLAILCPALPEVQAYTVALAEQFIHDWGFDGHKLDNIYTVPPCYNPAHQHAHPAEACAGFAEVYRLIFETTRALKPYSVTQICPCGTPLTHTLLPALDQAVTADPTSSAQIRQRIKVYKGLLGPRAAVFADHVELSDGGTDFASEIGAGGVPATKFVWPADPQVRARLQEWWVLTPEKEAIWRRWLALYDRYRLAEGETLNLYDLALDLPETHLIRRGERLYYAFYAPAYTGPVTLRGLAPRRYRLTDWATGRAAGVVAGPEATVIADFTAYWLLEAAPNDDTAGTDLVQMD